MTDIFVSYSRLDKDRVEPLVELFESNGYTVWWDANIVPGSTFESVIDNAILDASIVIVVWTENSIQSEWVQAEASDGMERGIMLPVMLDKIRIPVAFRARQSVQLLDWPNRIDNDEVNELLNALSNTLRKDPQSNKLPRQHPSVKRKIKPWAITIGLIALILSFYFIDQKFLIGNEPSSILPEDNIVTPIASINIPPFITGNIDQQQFKGISFEIAKLLKGSKELHIRSDQQRETQSIPLLSNSNPKSDSDYILNGSFDHNEDNRVILHLFLKHLPKGNVTWQRDYPISTQSIRETVKTVASDIASSFRVRLPVSKRDIESETYLLFLKAQIELRKPKSLESLEATKVMLQEIISKEPRFGDAYASLCQTELWLYQETQAIANFESAEKHCQRANTLNSGNSNVYLALGILYRELGKFKKSEDQFNRATEIAPFSTEIMREISKTHAMQREFSQAERLLETALNIEPSYWLNYREMGRIKFIQGQYRQAATYYKIESELIEDNSRALNNLGAAYFLAEEFELAIQAWESTKNLLQNDRTLSNLGSAYFFKKDFEKAARMYSSASQLAPNNHEYWSGLGEAMLFSGGKKYKEYYQKALDLAEPRLAINPNDIMLLSAISTYYAAVGESVNAQRIIDELIKMDLQDVYVVYDIARATVHLGDKVNASIFIDQLIDMGYSKTLVSLDANFDGLTENREKESSK